MSRHPADLQSGPPADTAGPRIPLYTPEFATDPHRVYRAARDRFGTLAPVELAPGVPATLVVGYHTAIRILNDPIRFPSDPRAWQRAVAADCPVLPMMAWRPNALTNDGALHTRYRGPNLAGIDGVDPHGLHAVVEWIAMSLINDFCQTGSADLIGQYAFPLIFAVINTIIGCTPELGQEIAHGMATVFEGGDGAERGNEIVVGALMRLVAWKRAEPGDDIATRVLAHPNQLDDLEAVSQLFTLYGAGLEPQQNLIANTMLLILTDDRFAGSVLDGSLSTRDAIEEVLFTDPPAANYCITYPKQPVLVEDVWLPAHQPVVISMAACNNDPTISGEFAGNRSQLTWGLGPHACPARHLALPIVEHAIDQLLDALPDMELAVPVQRLTWRPGPFHRALTALPVHFPAAPPLRT